MKRSVLGIAIAAITFSALFWYRHTHRLKPRELELTNTLIVGTSADFPPFSFRDSSNEIVGFDIAVAKEVARRMHKTMLLEDMRFELLLPELQMGHIHMIAAGLTATPEREKKILFTKPYLTGNPLVIVTIATNPPITGVEDLKGKEVLVNTGYTADTYMSKLSDELKLTRLATVAEAFAVLEQGGAYAFVTAANTLRPVLEKKEADKFNTFILQETDENNALAISKRYPAIRTEAQKALDEMKADGTLDALRQEWKVV